MRRSPMSSMAALKSFQKFAHQLLPGQIAGRDLVELFFQIRSEIVFDVFAEEVFQESRDQAAAVIRDEAVLVHGHVLAFAQFLQDCRVGGRPADAEFFQLLDEARFRDNAAAVR